MLRIIRGGRQTLHVYAYIMVRGSVIEQKRHIKTVRAFGQLAVFFIKRVDNLLGNHLWFINGVIKLGTNRWPNRPRLHRCRIKQPLRQPLLFTKFCVFTQFLQL